MFFYINVYSEYVHEYIHSNQKNIFLYFISIGPKNIKSGYKFCFREIYDGSSPTNIRFLIFRNGSLFR